MASVSINPNYVKLILTSPRSKVRICDNHGNHIARPSSEGIYDKDFFVEWMITNEEVVKLAKKYLNQRQINKTINKIQKIKKFLRDSKYYVRKAKKKKLNRRFSNFEIFEYKEKFYSFEKTIDSTTKVRITFKMGDYTLAAHMFVLFSFKSRLLKVYNNGGIIKKGNSLGSGAYGKWLPTKKQIISIIYTLAHASKNHRDDLIELLS